MNTTTEDKRLHKRTNIAMEIIRNPMKDGHQNLLFEDDQNIIKDIRQKHQAFLSLDAANQERILELRRRRNSEGLHFLQTMLDHDTLDISNNIQRQNELLNSPPRSPNAIQKHPLTSLPPVLPPLYRHPLSPRTAAKAKSKKTNDLKEPVDIDELCKCRYLRLPQKYQINK